MEAPVKLTAVRNAAAVHSPFSDSHRIPSVPPFPLFPVPGNSALPTNTTSTAAYLHSIRKR